MEDPRQDPVPRSGSERSGPTPTCPIYNVRGNWLCSCFPKAPRDINTQEWIGENQASGGYEICYKHGDSDQAGKEAR